MAVLPAGLYGYATILVVVSLVMAFLTKAVQQRRKFRNLPGPPHHWFWGHLKVMGEMQFSLPRRIHPHAYPGHIIRKYNIRSSVMYLDLWPFAVDMCLPLDPNVAQQFTVDYNTDKHVEEAKFMIPLAGEGNLVSSNGAIWKTWRSIMNPGFHPAHLMTLASGIVDDCLVFCKILDGHAERGDVFRMEEIATRLTVDIIGKVVLDLHLDTQHGDNILVDAFRDQVKRMPPQGYDLSAILPNPYMHYRRWVNSCTMDNYLGRILDERFSKKGPSEILPTGGRKQRKRAIIDLALESYAREQKGNADISDAMDATFKKYAVSQMKTFLFAGHDTTSSTICYAYHLLSKHPACLQKIREEHDRVLGGVVETPERIKRDPYILNQLDYTLAVTKEVLRLWPPASGVRVGNENLYLRDPETGTLYPTANFLLWDAIYMLHHSESVWGPTASLFDPDRFLPTNASKLPPHAWRPFEKGPRNCIGQDLALLETKIILALTIRTFDTVTAYDRLGEIANDGTSWSTLDSSFREAKQDDDGEEAYQVLIATAKPREGMPMRVFRTGV